MISTRNSSVKQIECNNTDEVDSFIMNSLKKTKQEVKIKNKSILRNPLRLSTRQKRKNRKVIKKQEKKSTI